METGSNVTGSSATDQIIDIACKFMRQREFLSALSGAAAWPLAVRVQQEERVGMLTLFAETDREGQMRLAAFRGVTTSVLEPNKP